MLILILFLFLPDSHSLSLPWASSSLGYPLGFFIWAIQHIKTPTVSLLIACITFCCFYKNFKLHSKSFCQRLCIYKPAHVILKKTTVTTIILIAVQLIRRCLVVVSYQHFYVRIGKLFLNWSEFLESGYLGFWGFFFFLLVLSLTGSCVTV